METPKVKFSSGDRLLGVVDVLVVDRESLEKKAMEREIARNAERIGVFHARGFVANQLISPQFALISIWQVVRRMLAARLTDRLHDNLDYFYTMEKRVINDIIDRNISLKRERDKISSNKLRLIRDEHVSAESLLRKDMSESFIRSKKATIILLMFRTLIKYHIKPHK